MHAPKLTRLEVQIMETLWSRGECSIREVLEAFPGDKKPGYGTVQTTMYRMEAKKIVRRTRKVANFHLFDAVISREAAQRTLVDDVLALFQGRSQMLMMHLVKSGNLRLEDIKAAQRELQKLAKQEDAS